MRKKVLSILLIAVLALSLVACGSNDAEIEATTTTNASATTVTIGYLPITHSLAALEEKELLDNEGNEIRIELQKFSSWSDLTDALNAGQIDGASVLIELAMSAVSQGIPLKALALGHKDGNVIVANDSVQTVADLRGKTVAIPHTQSSHNILVQDALTQAGLTTADIEVVQLAPTEMPSSLASGAIDAYCVAEPFGAQAVNLSFGHVLASSEELWQNSLCCGLVFHQNAIDRLGDENVTNFIYKYYEACHALDSTEALRIATSYLGQEESVLQTSLQWIKFDDVRISETDYNDLVNRVVAYGINTNPPSYQDFVYQIA